MGLHGWPSDAEMLLPQLVSTNDCMHEIGCRFCLPNSLLVDEPLQTLDYFYLLGNIELERPAQAMIVPIRHVATPFDLNNDEWSELGMALDRARVLLDKFRPSGWTIGWNVGSVAGQEIFHAHLHIIARFEDEPTSGRGIHALFRSP